MVNKMSLINLVYSVLYYIILIWNSVTKTTKFQDLLPLNIEDPDKGCIRLNNKFKNEDFIDVKNAAKLFVKEQEMYIHWFFSIASHNLLASFLDRTEKCTAFSLGIQGEFACLIKMILFFSSYFYNETI